MQYIRTYQTKLEENDRNEIEEIFIDAFIYIYSHIATQRLYVLSIFIYLHNVYMGSDEKINMPPLKSKERRHMRRWTTKLQVLAKMF